MRNQNTTRLRGIISSVLIGGALTATASMCGAAPATADEAASGPVQQRAVGQEIQAPAACGFNPGRGEYFHCDNGTGLNVMLTVNDIWGYAGQYCVKPGVTQIQWAYEWRIAEAYFNGGTGCMPGPYQ